MVAELDETPLHCKAVTALLCTGLQSITNPSHCTGMSLKYERCRCAGEPMLAAAWSADGSLLAAAAGDTATLWEPTSNALLATLPTPLPAVGTPLRHLAFVAGTPFLVSCRRRHC